jgi:hypothetical protein
VGAEGEKKIFVGPVFEPARPAMPARVGRVAQGEREKLGKMFFFVCVRWPAGNPATRQELVFTEGS